MDLSVQAPSVLPLQTISQDVMVEKYLRPEERGAHDVYRRVARALASVEPLDRDHWQQSFYDNMLRGAIGAGRIMYAAGTRRHATMLNCFVQPIGDVLEGRDQDGYPSVKIALQEALHTMRMGGGVGYDFSRIRPRVAQSLDGTPVEQGPCTVISQFNHYAATVYQTGGRRAAQMGVLRIDHPDIVEFITTKRGHGVWSHFNLSVAVTDAWMHAVKNNTEWDLVHAAPPCSDAIAAGAHLRGDGLWVYGKISAQDLWEQVMQSAYDFAEPGILFVDHLNHDNNLRYCEHIEATNPCGEQPLPPYGCCDLGSLILPKFVHHPFGFSDTPYFDFESFKKAVGIQVRALDNALDLTRWPLPEQREQALTKRRIGVGFTGLGNALTMLKLRYNSQEGRDMAVLITEAMRNAAYGASIELAQEKGIFPAFKVDGYLEEGTFASRLPSRLQKKIRQHGMRNSHLLSIAPTGSVSLAFADNTSSGIEPAYAWRYTRNKYLPDGTSRLYTVEDHAWRLYQLLAGPCDHPPEYFVSALEMSTREHLAMLEAVQPLIDSAISKTVNLPASYPFEDFKDLYEKAWHAKLKGLTTYRPNMIIGQVLCSGKGL
jgi:ribonucleoside-diphosphate reductase alpha chain